MTKNYIQHIIQKKQRIPFTPENGLCCHCQIVYKRPELGSPGNVRTVMSICPLRLKLETL